MTYDWIAEELYIIFYQSFFNRLIVYSLTTQYMYNSIYLVYNRVSGISYLTEVEMTFNPFER